MHESEPTQTIQIPYKRLLRFIAPLSNCRAISTAIAIVPTIWKPDQSKSGHFCPDFKWFLTKWCPVVWISNNWVSRFQIPLEIPTIGSNPTSFWPFKIQTCLDFRYPLRFILKQINSFHISFQLQHSSWIYENTPDLPPSRKSNFTSPMFCYLCLVETTGTGCPWGHCEVPGI